MGMWIGRNRKARVTYGFDEIALVPGDITINPNEVDIAFRIPRRDAEPITLKYSDPGQRDGRRGRRQYRPSPWGKLGGLAVLNLEGVQTRYENPDEVLGGGRHGRQREGHHSDSEALSRADVARTSSPSACRRSRGRRGLFGQLHSAKGRALRRHCPGGGRRRVCRPVDGLHRAAYLHGVQDARHCQVLRIDKGARDRWQHGDIQRDPRADANAEWPRF